MTKKRAEKSSPVKSRGVRNFKKKTYSVKAKVLNEVLYESHNEVFLFDTGSLRFIFANKVALENLGYTLSELRRFTPVRIHTGFTTSSFRRLVDTLLVQQKERLSFESKLKRKDGSHYMAEVNLLLSGPEGKKVFVAILNDISERKQANETLHLLQKAVETGGEGIAITDAKKTGNPIIYANQEFLRLTGYTGREKKSRSLYSLFGEKTSRDALTRLNGCLKLGEPFKEEILCYKKNKTTFWNRISITPVFIGKSEPRYFIIFNYDITEKIKARKALLESEEMFRSLAESSHSLIVKINPDGKIEYINRSEKTDAGKVLGTNMYAHIKDEYVPSVKKIIEEAFRKGLPGRFEAEIIYDTGSYSWYSTAVGPIKKEGRVVSAILTNLNIDALKKSERFMENQNALLERVAVKTPLEEIVQAVSGNCSLYFKSDGAFTLLRDEARSRFRISEYSYVPETMAQFLLAACTHCTSSPVLVNIPLGTLQPCCALTEKLAGKYRTMWSVPVQTSYKKQIGNMVLLFKKETSPVRRSEKELHSFVNIIAIAAEQEKSDMELQELYTNLEQRVHERTTNLENEIENRKKIEGELHKAKNEADAANQAKTTFLANMSHEIRTPLNAIIGFCDILMKKAQKNNLSPNFTEYLNNIKSSSQNLAYIINEILDIAKIEAGKMSVTLAEFDIEQLVKTIFHTNKSLALQKKIRFNYSIDPKTPRHIISDRTKIYQILTNLINNAIKFTAEGNEVEFHVGIRGKNTLILKVKDTGIGIEEKSLSLIFSPFYQTDTSRTRHHEGTGLGLTITQKMVEFLKGSIFVESTFEKGTLFIVEIPFGKAMKREGHKVIAPVHQDFQIPSGIRVLLVEDNVVNQRMMKELFQELGNSIFICGSGKETLDQLDALRPDIIFMDVHMPEMDGIQLTRKIRELAPCAHVPIIGFSADAFTDTIEAGLNAGMNGYLTKPLDTDKLLHTLSAHLDLSLPEKARPDPIPESSKGQLREKLERLLTIPIYNTELLVRTAGEISAFCKENNFFLPDRQLEDIKDAIYKGDGNSLNDLIKSILNG